MARVLAWSLLLAMGVIVSVVDMTNGHSLQLKFVQQMEQDYEQSEDTSDDESEPVSEESEVNELWTLFMKTFQKSYADDSEEEYRRSIWLENVAMVQAHNLQADLGQHSFTLGINEYSDLSMAEYKKILLGTRPPANYTASTSQDDYYTYDYAGDLPSTVDWRDKGYVTPVKNQGACGSCWAFSSTGSLEGQNFKKTGKLISLSEQDLVDCTTTCGNNGCGGGWMTWAFTCVAKQGGIDTEQSYPYEGIDDKCRFKTSTVGATDTGYTSIKVGDEQALLEAVATVGPISVAIDANHPEFFQYKSGVLNIPDCTPNVDHGVLVVGYGTQDGQDYWLVKNSWGTSWGMNGYVMMARNKKNQCAIASYAVYPKM